VRHFGIDEANDLLPVIKKAFDDVRALAARAQQLFEGEADPESVVERQKLVEKIQTKLQPLLDMGIEVKAIYGLVDFRALRNGKTVYLCWKYGEEEVGHWHELDAGFAGRRPIDSKDEFAPTYLS
jgi:hypothetical protein